MLHVHVRSVAPEYCSLFAMFLNDHHGLCVVRLLHITSATEEHSGTFACFAQNVAGSDERELSLEVQGQHSQYVCKRYVCCIHVCLQD